MPSDAAGWVIEVQSVQPPTRGPALIAAAAFISSRMISELLLCERNLLVLSFMHPLCRTGRIDSQEILQSLRDLGVHISEEQAEKILKR